MKTIFSYRSRYLSAIGIITALCALLTPMKSGLGKGKPKPVAAPEKVVVVLPADLNLASLRVTALDTIYEFDLSAAQLKLLLAESAGSADTAPRTAVAPNEKLSAALNELAQALLDSNDDAQIAKFRNAVIDLTGESAPLNDEVHPTAHATSAAPKVFAMITATQIASYLATHAHEVGDPQEVLLGAVDELHNTRVDDPDGKNAESTAEANALIEETATDVGFLIGGLDDAKAKDIAGQVTALLKSAYAMKEAEFKAQEPAIQASIEKLTADVPAIQVLSNWIQRQVAVLLSNPQLPEAIAARQHADAAKRPVTPSATPSTTPSAP